ncbi:hypothetical protein ACFQX6_38845 [Streptosporangium lutulentum]
MAELRVVLAEDHYLVREGTLRSCRPRERSRWWRPSAPPTSCSTPPGGSGPTWW